MPSSIHIIGGGGEIKAIPISNTGMCICQFPTQNYKV